MRTHSIGATYISHTLRRATAGAGLGLLAVLAISPSARPEPGAPAGGEDGEPQGLPPAHWPASPYRGAIDGWTGKPIPCRCRFNGKAYRLGEIVCMRTHVGIVLTRCDIFENNTSWIPSRQPCVPDAGM